MFLERTERLALVDFENKHINYIDLINNIIETVVTEFTPALLDKEFEKYSK